MILCQMTGISKFNILNNCCHGSITYCMYAMIYHLPSIWIKESSTLLMAAVLAAFMWNLCQLHAKESIQTFFLVLI